MLTGTAQLDTRVSTEMLKFLRPNSTVYLLGGYGALSKQVEADVTALGFVPQRLAGNDRFDTAVKVADAINPHPHTVLVATGTDYPDALAAGSTLPAATQAYLSATDPTTTTVIGVGGGAVRALTHQPGYQNHFGTLAGPDRFATALAVATSPLFPNPTTAGLATATNWPDALSGGAFLGYAKAPLLLTDGGSIPSGEAAWLHTIGKQLTGLTVFGGLKVVPQSAVDAASAATWGP